MTDLSITVRFPISEKLDIVADYLEELGYVEISDILRKDRPKFKVGEICKFPYGTNFMKITEILKDSTFLYKGRMFMGGGMGLVIEEQCVKMSREEQEDCEKRFQEKLKRIEKLCRFCQIEVYGTVCSNCNAIYVARDLPDPPEFTKEIMEQIRKEGEEWSRAVSEGTKNLERRY